MRSLVALGFAVVVHVKRAVVCGGMDIMKLACLPCVAAQCGLVDWCLVVVGLPHRVADAGVGGNELVVVTSVWSVAMHTRGSRLSCV